MRFRSRRLSRLPTAAVIAGVVVVAAIFVAVWLATRSGSSKDAACRTCDDQSRVISSSAGPAALKALRHFGEDPSGAHIRCTATTPRDEATATRFAVTCMGRTGSGAPVLLSTAHAALAGGPVAYLTGRWRLKVGKTVRQLPCLPENWAAAYPCGQRIAKLP